MKKLFVPYVEFYITNVCNLSCPGCNRFNDYKFKGYQKWSDFKDVYSRWANELVIGNIAILGGEPLLNPDFLDWVDGISNLWRRKIIRIISNGFHLPKVSGLYSVLQSNKYIKLWIGIHNKQHKKEIFSILESFLQKPFTYKFNTDDKYNQFIDILDANGVEVRVEYNWWFHQGSLVKNSQTNTITLHASNAEKAHDICNMKTCHHFIKGKLYKCGPVALLPEFDEQFTLELSGPDRTLLESYKPLTIEDSIDQKTMFINNLTNSIPQCKFCPEVYLGDIIYSKKKKDLQIL